MLVYQRVPTKKLRISPLSQDQYWLRDLDQSPLQLQHEVLRFATGRVVKEGTPTRRLAAATKYIEVWLGEHENAPRNL